MTAPRLSRLFAPRSVAVIGGGWGRSVIETLQRGGFGGPIWPVHPSKAEIGGLASVPTLAALPGVPDAAFLAINRDASIEAVAALSALGTGGAVSFASGYAETGDAERQSRLAEAAGSMPLLGPNCYGMINALESVALWPDQHGLRPVRGGVALVSHSSNIAVNWTMQARGLPIAHVVCTGNEAQTGMAEIGAALLADPRVTALGLYIEAVRDAVAFAAMAEAAHAAGKPVIAIKAGRSSQAQAAAASHTAALAGSAVASSAFLRQCGVVEVTTPAALLEALKLAHLFGRIPGRRVAAMACSGGEAGLMADRLSEAGLTMPRPSATAAQALAATLGPLVTIANPLDYHTGIWGDCPAMAQVFGLMTGPEFDLTVLVCDLPHPSRCDGSAWEVAVAALEAAQRQSGARMALLATLPECLPEAMADRLMAAGIAPLNGLGPALAAIAALARASDTPEEEARVGKTRAGVIRAEKIRAEKMRAGWRPLPNPARAESRLLDEAEAKSCLAAAGLSIPDGGRAATIAEARAKAAALGGPVALKGLGFAHKSEAGAVRLNLSPAEIDTPIPGAQGYLVERMVSGGVAELLIGLQRDPNYGATLTLGLGGVTAELLADTATLILPATPTEIHRALMGLRLAPLLTGYRGRPMADLEAAVAAAMTLAALFVADPQIAEIEINPLILRETGQGAVAADALIRRREQ